MSEPGGVNGYDISNLLEENTLITLSPLKSVHLIISQGAPSVLKASMTKPKKAAKQLGISTATAGGAKKQNPEKMLLAMKISKMKSLTHLKI